MNDIDSHDRIIFKIMCPRSYDRIISLALNFVVLLYWGSVLTGFHKRCISTITVELPRGETVRYSSSIVFFRLGYTLIAIKVYCMME